mmetsp:Transcript_25735/g.60628  ORF Transcript_25735/g.60628 Transcript_25735/m.60628 type:complete len:87 (+) Transcript_25735:2309-2569(+)
MRGVIRTLVEDDAEEDERAVGGRVLVPIPLTTVRSFDTNAAVINFTGRRRSFRDTVDSNLEQVILTMRFLRRYFFLSAQQNVVDAR